jgi:hypothetical protein
MDRNVRTMCNGSKRSGAAAAVEALKFTKLPAARRRTGPGAQRVQVAKLH